LLCFVPYISPLRVSTLAICTETVLPFLWLVLTCEKNILVTMIRARGGEHAGKLYLDTLQKLRGMSCLMCERHCSLGAFANLRKVTVSCTMSVCLSVCLCVRLTFRMEDLGCLWKDFLLNLISEDYSSICRKIH